ncbi:MAG TPA: polysaccharide deacetylase family protein [Gaiellaceae bacterium]
MRVALTFDTEFPGRPAVPGVEERILAALAEAGAVGTFFLQGRWARANSERARAIAAAGHAIGNHSNYHAPLNGLQDELLRQDVRKAEQTIRMVTGLDPRPLFRCPFGAGRDDPRVLLALAELGYRHVGWDIDPRDWEEGRTPAELERRVLDRLRERGADAIVLLHGWPTVTAAALPPLLGALSAESVELVSVDGLASA